MPRTTSRLDIMIIGGGASGLLAAIYAARAGARVTLLEKNNQLGRKLLATGNGRCNLSHRPCLPESFFSNGQEFVDSFLSAWDTDTLLAELGDLGLAFCEDDGRIYPASKRAENVVRLLEHHSARAGVTAVTNTPVTDITYRGGKFTVVTQDQREYTASKLIVTTGGYAGPAYGSTGDGYSWLEALGHTLEPTHPALVPLKTKHKRLHDLQGVKCDVRGAVVVDGDEVAAETDELLFTKYGLSGPLAMNLSRHYAPARGNVFRIDFVPGLTREELAALLSSPSLPLELRLAGLLPVKVVRKLLALMKIDASVAWEELSDQHRALLLKRLQRWEEPLGGNRGYAEAKVTAGGVRTAELDPETLQSRNVPGLYLAGEIIDVDGRSGGHNLHFAFASGITAGRAAAGK